MYKENMRGILRTQTFIHLGFFVRTHIYSFDRTLCFSMNSTQVFVHEAPGKVGYEPNVLNQQPDDSPNSMKISKCNHITLPTVTDVLR